MCIQVYQTYTCKDIKGNTVQHKRSYIIRCSTPDWTRHSQPCLEALDELHQVYEIQCPDCTGESGEQGGRGLVDEEFIDFADNGDDDPEGTMTSKTALAVLHYYLALARLLVAELSVVLLECNIGRDRDRVLEVFDATIPEIFCRFNRTHDFGGIFLGLQCCNGTGHPELSNIAWAVRRVRAVKAFYILTSLFSKDERGEYTFADEAFPLLMEPGRRATDLQGVSDEVEDTIVALGTPRNPHGSSHTSDPENPFSLHNEPYTAAEIDQRYRLLVARLGAVRQKFGSYFEGFDSPSLSGRPKERLLCRAMDILARDVGLSMKKTLGVFECFLPMILAKEHRNPEELENNQLAHTDLAKVAEEFEASGLEMPSKEEEDFSSYYREWERKINHWVIDEYRGQIQGEMAIVELGKEKVDALIRDGESCCICGEEYLREGTVVEEPVRLRNCQADHHAGRRCLIKLAGTTHADSEGKKVASCPMCRAPFVSDDPPKDVAYLI